METYYLKKNGIVKVKQSEKGAHIKPLNGYPEYMVILDLDKNNIWVKDEDGKRMKWYKRKYGEPVVKLINRDGTIAEKYMSEVEKENFEVINGPPKTKQRLTKNQTDILNAQMKKIEQYYLNNKVIYNARVPFVDFSKPYLQLDAETEERIEDAKYMTRYYDICYRLSTGKIQYDDLTIWEQDLCANRGVRNEDY